MIALGSWGLRAVGLQRWYPTQRLHSLSWLLALVLPPGLSLALVWACLSPALPNLHRTPRPPTPSQEHHCISNLHHSAFPSTHTAAAQPNAGMSWQAHCPDCEPGHRADTNTTFLLQFEPLTHIHVFLCICCCFCLKVLHSYSHTHTNTHTHSVQSRLTLEALSYAAMPITEQMTLCCVACCHSELSYSPHLQLSQTIFFLAVPVNEENPFICFFLNSGKGPTFPIFNSPPFSLLSRNKIISKW